MFAKIMTVLADYSMVARRWDPGPSWLGRSSLGSFTAHPTKPTGQ